MPPHDGGVQDQASVRCESGRAVEWTVGEDLYLVRPDIHEREAVAVLRALDISEGLAVRTVARRHVVVAFERHALDIISADSHAIDLRTAAAVGSEQHIFTVGRKARLGVDGTAVGDARQAGPVRIDEIELRDAVLGECQGYALAVRGPCGSAVDPIVGGQHATRPVDEIVDEDDRAALLERHVGDARAVRRPGRRNDRLLVRENELRVDPVGVGDVQLEALRKARHVGDARAEHTGLAGELLVDDVGDLMRDGAQLRHRDGIGIAHHLCFLGGIQHAEAHLDFAVRARGHLADHQRLRAAVLPVAIVHLARLGGQRPYRADVLYAEAAAARQVRSDDLADALLELVLSAERQHGDRDLISAAADNFNGELCTRRRCTETYQADHEAPQGVGTKDRRYAVMVHFAQIVAAWVSLEWSEFVLGFAQLLEQVGLTGHRQRLRCANRALYCSVISRHAARSYQLDVEYFSPGQQRHAVDRLGIAVHAGRHHHPTAYLELDPINILVQQFLLRRRCLGFGAFARLVLGTLTRRERELLLLFDDRRAARFGLPLKPALVFAAHLFDLALLLALARFLLAFELGLT